MQGGCLSMLTSFLNHVMHTFEFFYVELKKIVRLCVYEKT